MLLLEDCVVTLALSVITVGDNSGIGHFPCSSCSQKELLQYHKQINCKSAFPFCFLLPGICPAVQTWKVDGLMSDSGNGGEGVATDLRKGSDKMNSFYYFRYIIKCIK